MAEQPKFGPIRNFLCPIASSELKKFVPMMLMIFFIAANYNMLKIIKDATVIPTVGAEVIPFIKVWMMLPGAVLMTAFFSFLVSRFDENRAFYIVIGTFLSFFFLFVFILFPNKEFFYLDSLASFLESFLPSGIKGFTNLIRYWHLCVFYTMCEIWGTMVLFVLFWGFANRVIHLHEAKRFYALFGLAGNSSGMVAPLFFSFLSGIPVQRYFGSQWEQTLVFIFLAVLISGLVTLGLYFYVYRYVSSNGDLVIGEVGNMEKAEKKKNKKSFKESLLMLHKEAYIRNIAIIVLSYNILINLTEVLWKAQIKSLYPSQMDYGLYFGKVMFFTGVIATISDLIVCSNVIRRFGWTVGAMITPVIFLVTSIGFFGLLIFDSIFESILVHMTGLTPLALTALFGSVQNALSRAAKYSLFDATKEISFIPLESQRRIQSKAAIDGVCSRLGKSGGSVIYQVLLVSLGSLTACIPYVAVIAMGLMGFWFHSVLDLGRRFKDLTAKNSL